MNYSHGNCYNRIYGVWNAMKQRCSNPNNQAYDRYGGRGISYCARWEKFANFLEDMGQPQERFTLERIDNDKDYSKENCVWATYTQQGRNKRNNVMLTIDGETLPLSAWAEKYGLKYGTVHRRYYKLKWSAESAVKTPLIPDRTSGAEHGVVFQDDRKAA